MRLAIGGGVRREALQNVAVLRRLRAIGIQADAGDTQGVAFLFPCSVKPHAKLKANPCLA